MSKLANTPEPPYYAVIAPAVLNADVKGYPEMAAQLLALAPEIDGFLGIETCIQGRFLMAVSYWRSLDAIETWRRNSHHLRAKDQAKTKWFESYITRIAKVERVY